MKIYTFKDLKFIKTDIEGVEEAFLLFDNEFSFNIHTNPFFHCYIIIVHTKKRLFLSIEYPLNISKKHISALMRKIQLLTNLK